MSEINKYMDRRINEMIKVLLKKIKEFWGLESMCVLNQKTDYFKYVEIAERRLEVWKKIGL